MLVLPLGACGKQKRQDENEPRGNFEVEVLQASFPKEQKLAKRSDLVIKVRNAGSRTIPNIAVTLDGLGFRRDDAEVSDPNRPIFIINGRQTKIAGLPESQQQAPEGCDTAYVNTWACGRLPAGAERTFRWNVTASEARRYRIEWTVAAGLDGKAKAVDVDTGARPTGVFSGRVSDRPPETRVAEDGERIVEGTR